MLASVVVQVKSVMFYDLSVSGAETVCTWSARGTIRTTATASTSGVRVADPKSLDSPSGCTSLRDVSVAVNMSLCLICEFP